MTLEQAITVARKTLFGMTNVSVRDKREAYDKLAEFHPRVKEDTISVKDKVQL